MAQQRTRAELCRHSRMRVLHTIIVLNALVHITTLFSFPPVRLALIAFPAPTPVHQPCICLLLVVLDLSYNLWLNEPPGGQSADMEWAKW